MSVDIYCIWSKIDLFTIKAIVIHLITFHEEFLFALSLQIQIIFCKQFLPTTSSPDTLLAMIHKQWIIGNNEVKINIKMTHLKIMQPNHTNVYTNIIVTDFMGLPNRVNGLKHVNDWLSLGQLNFVWELPRDIIFSANFKVPYFDKLWLLNKKTSSYLICYTREFYCTTFKVKKRK